jgi:hypothetical protein
MPKALKRRQNASKPASKAGKKPTTSAERHAAAQRKHRAKKAAEAEAKVCIRDSVVFVHLHCRSP